MNDSIASEIVRAAKELNLTPDEFSECSPEHARRVVLAANKPLFQGIRGHGGCL